MDYDELYELRKKLADWKNQSHTQTLNILKRLEQSVLDQEALTKSKILKTIHCLAQQETKDNSVEEAQIIGKSILLVKRIKTILSSKKESPPPPPPVMVKQSSSCSKPLPNIDLFQNHRIPPSYADRGKYLTGLGKQFIFNIQIYREEESLSQEIQQTIKEIVEKLEKIIYFKRQSQSNSRQAYELDIKTLVQFLKKDRNGAVTFRLLSGAFDLNVAAALKSSDWLDDFSKQEQARLIQEKIAEQQTGFYKDLSKREMEGIEGKCCKGCGLKKVYLVEEKQTRASDEPTTKFFECYNCGDKFRIC